MTAPLERKTIPAGCAQASRIVCPAARCLSHIRRKATRIPSAICRTTAISTWAGMPPAKWAHRPFASTRSASPRSAGPARPRARSHRSPARRSTCVSPPRSARAGTAPARRSRARAATTTIISSMARDCGRLPRHTAPRPASRSPCVPICPACSFIRAITCARTYPLGKAACGTAGGMASAGNPVLAEPPPALPANFPPAPSSARAGEYRRLTQFCFSSHC